MATLDHISGAEPSTVTFKLRTATFTQNSSKMHSEVMVLGDPDSTNALVAVLNATPASTAWGLAVRPVGTAPTSGDSTVFQGSSAWQVQVTNQARVTNSSAGDFLATISGNSTVAPLAGSAWVVRSSKADALVSVYQSTAAELQATVTPASTTWQVQIHGDSTVFQGTSPWVVAGASTVAPLAGSTWNTRPIQSSASDLQMTATQGGTWTVNVGSHIQSSAAPSSNSSGIVVRQVVDQILTTASTSAFASTALTIQSSGAGLRSYVTAYSITTTNAGPSKIGFYSSGVVLWPILLAAVSSAVSGVNLAVSAPAYLFRTIGAADALTLNLGGGASTVGGWRVGVSYFRAP